jgi:putative FmdB family regulatory protein
MPTYDYRCLACGHDFEAFQKISDPPRARCPRCGKTRSQRRISAPQFILRGNGFYVNDSKSPAPAAKESPKPSAPAAKDAANPAGTPAKK